MTKLKKILGLIATGAIVFSIKPLPTYAHEDVYSSICNAAVMKLPSKSVKYFRSDSLSQGVRDSIYYGSTEFNRNPNAKVAQTTTSPFTIQFSEYDFGPGTEGILGSTDYQTWNCTNKTYTFVVIYYNTRSVIGAKPVSTQRWVGAHELGHAAGLGHPDDQGSNNISIMISTLNKAATRTTLQTHDFDDLRIKYP